MEQNNFANKKNYNAIDLVKFICSILIVMIHFHPFGKPEYGTASYYLNSFISGYAARLAVPFFFVSSGFFLFKKTTLKNYDRSIAKNYALRILRLYIIWTIIYLPINLAYIFTDERGIKHGTLIYIRDLILSGSYTQLWYLNATVFAVILVSLLIYKKIPIKKIIVIAFILYFIGLFGETWFGFIKPLKDTAPIIWNGLRLTKKVIVTTRNGLFFGFIFIAMGMYFSFTDYKMKRRTSLIGFIISMILLFAEFILLTHFDFIYAQDMYLFLIPVTFFGFNLIRDWQLPDSPIYKKLRILSSLIYYTHTFIGKVIDEVLKKVNDSLSNIGIVFICTLLVTIIISYIIMKLSEKPKYKFLKSLYV